MEKQNESMRERLLAHLPQPENLAAYREETASLLAKHEKALFWENRMPSIVCSVSAIAILIADRFWAQKIDQVVWFGVGLLIFAAALTDLRYRIDRSKVDTLKEVKQVQLQILEVQASLQKRGSETCSS
jgi:hypothetical protein